MPVKKEPLIRDSESWEEHFDRTAKRYPYQGVDDFTGQWEAEVFPYVTSLCRNCMKKYYYKDGRIKAKLEKGLRLNPKRGFCMTCGRYYDMLMDWKQITLFLSKDSWKRVYQQEHFKNTRTSKEKVDKKTEKRIKNKLNDLR